MKKNIMLLLIAVMGMNSYGQQDSQYTQYMYNTMNINPGYTGTRGVMSILGLYRTQWVGLDGAPKTGTFTIHSPITASGQGLGFSVVNDQIGVSKETTVSASYSYPIQLSATVKLSLGISVSGNFLEVDYNRLTIHDNPDSELRGVINQTSPNVGAGAYFHAEKWYAGLSVPRFLETEFYDDIQTSVATEKMHFYVMGGYVFDLNESLQFKPAAMVKAVNGAPLAVDISANFLFNEKFTLGVAYRWDASVSGMAGFQISRGLNIGYAYDFDTERLGKYNSGSHEIFLRFDLISPLKARMMSPRFF